MKRLAVLVFVAACGSKSPPPPAPAPVGGPLANTAPAPAPAPAPASDDAAYDQKAVAMMKQLGAVMRDNAGDCTKLASELHRFNDENSALLQEFRDREKTETPEQKKAFEDKHKDDIADMMKAMEPAMKKCAADPGVQASMKEMIE